MKAESAAEIKAVYAAQIKAKPATEIKMRCFILLQEFWDITL